MDSSRELADAAGLRRVDFETGRQMFARKSGDLAGIIIPNVAPWDGQVREYRIRLDNPPLEHRSDGSIRETNKYIQPPGRGNLLYFPPGVVLPMLEDVSLPVIITEGEFKALALWRLADSEIPTPRFLPVATAGVWNWRTTIAKIPGPNGKRRDIKGILPDFERITWKGRRVIIAYIPPAEFESGAA